MQNRFGLLDTDVMPIFMIIALDVFIIMRFSINCSAVIWSPTVKHAILREANNTVGEQITAEQLIEERIIMTASKEMITNIGIMSESSIPTPACIYYYYSTHQPLSSMHLEY